MQSHCRLTHTLQSGPWADVMVLFENRRCNPRIGGRNAVDIGANAGTTAPANVWAMDLVTVEGSDCDDDGGDENGKHQDEARTQLSSR